MKINRYIGIPVLALTLLTNSCTLPKPIEKIKGEAILSNDGKLTYSETENGFIVKGIYESREGQFEYTSKFNNLDDKVARMSGVIFGHIIVAYDGLNENYLDGNVDYAETPMGNFYREDNKEAEAQNGLSKKEVNYYCEMINYKYQNFRDYLKEQFDPELVEFPYE